MDGVLRYEGEWMEGDMHGQGKMYTQTGQLIYEGEFDKCLLVETQVERKSRAEAFMKDCKSMETASYTSWQDDPNMWNTPLNAWATISGMSDQDSTGTVIIKLNDDANCPVALSYRYAVDEAKVTAEDGSINAWGYSVGTFEYTVDGKPVTCPLIEVVYWTTE